ncbi:MAG: response regulator transcription factor [Lachnospirales bacterium]
MKTVLIVDDEINILELLRYNLEKEGYNVISCQNGKDVDVILSNEIDLIILDLMLPEINGIDILKNLKKGEFKNIPVILLTAKSDEIDKVIGLELGADDYISKPFGTRELMARIKVVFRRSNNVKCNNDIIKRYNIEMDTASYIVTKDNEKIDLTLKEYELLKHLITHEGRVVSREILLEKIWGFDYLGETRTVDVHIRQLRKKIEDDDKEPYFIETVRGVGYKFRKE